MVLIKAVLQSLQIYYMSTSQIPNNVIEKLNGLMRSFFWGKMDKPRYMAYVAWEHLCKPLEMGGLGFKDLRAMNDAMLIKFLWRLASNSNAQWVHLIRGKYLARSMLWSSKRTYNCTVFWRHLMNLRATLLLALSWVIGDGKSCAVMGEPWCNISMQMGSVSVSDKNVKIRDLVDEETGMWDCSKIINILGHLGCLKIISARKPPVDGDGSDRLVCN